MTRSAISARVSGTELKVDVDPAATVESGELALVVDLTQAVVLAGSGGVEPTAEV